MKQRTASAVLPRKKTGLTKKQIDIVLYKLHNMVT